MNIASPYSRLIAFDEDGNQLAFTRRMGVGLLRKIEWNARISHRSEDARTETSWERFLTAVVMEKGDWSVVEHASATVDTLVDRGITHEWVRHRLFSFTQESTRFVNYEKKMPASFVEPSWDDSMNPYTGDESLSLNDRRKKAKECWVNAISTAETSYRNLLRLGLTPQIARSVFPNALSSRISTTGNLRQWRHFFMMRTSKEAHPQMREVSIPLLREFQEKIPLLYADIEPLARQADNLKKPR